MDQPKFGIGTYQLDKNTAYRIIKTSIELGVRHFDTAYRYKNEEEVGKAINDSTIDRKDVFVCTKIWSSDIKDGKKGIYRGLRRSLSRLNIDYIDLILLHVPMRDDSLLKESWKILERIVLGEIEEFKNKVRYIGVSNYNTYHLDQILDGAKVFPYVNQIEVSPFLTRRVLVEYCKEKGIPIVAHSSLTKGEKLEDERLKEMASFYRVTPAQILLQWAIQKGFTIIPRTSRRDHLEENISIDIQLIRDHMERLDSFDEGFAVHKQYITKYG